ncbi:MAG: hypothetical protein ACRDTR_12860 [Rubrobacter sp.]
MIARGSVPVLERPERDAPLVTEVVVGERLEILGSSPGWFEVAVPSHASCLDPPGYPGWVRDDALVDGDAWAPDLSWTLAICG